MPALYSAFDFICYCYWGEAGSWGEGEDWIQVSSKFSWHSPPKLGYLWIKDMVSDATVLRVTTASTLITSWNSVANLTAANTKFCP